jgi:glycerol-3-phosphate dehydrogenase
MRDLRQLADGRFDLVIVGAGIYGAIAAWDATLRGLSVALIDQGDFGGATSFNNLKTLHGGLRALQALNLRQMRLFIRERRALARIAPHLIAPMAFLAPTYREPRRSAFALGAALAINDFVARDRHQGVDDEALQLPHGRLLAREDCLALNPVIDPAGVTGGALWYDYQMYNADRVTLSFVLSAASRGALVANYVRVDGLLRDGDRVAGVAVRDMRSSAAFDIRAGAVLNAAGPWAASWLAALTPPLAAPAAALSRAMNLVIRRVDVTQGCAGLAGGRYFFLVPWRDVTLIGTSHDPHHGTADDVEVTPAELERFLADARIAFPRAGLAPEAVRLVHRGLLPSTGGRGRVTLLRESRVIDHRWHGLAGLVSMFGVRYTTARHTAALAVDTVFAASGRSSPRCRTDVSPVIGGAIGDKRSFVAGIVARDSPLSHDGRRRVALTYGTDAERIVRLATQRPELAQPLGGACAVSGAEIVHAARHESAVTLADALVRRTEAGSAGHPGDDAIANAAALMASELSWSPERTAAEIAAVGSFYRLPGWTDVGVGGAVPRSVLPRIG